MPILEARGVEIAWSERGEGQPVLLVHETAADAAVWDAVVEALAERARAISYDRRGWGASSAPEDYRRTTVEEQSEDAAVLLESADAAPAVVAGAGVGAMVALDLLLRRPELVAGTLLIEPPVLQLLPFGHRGALRGPTAAGDGRRLRRGRDRPLSLGRPAGARGGGEPAPGGADRGRPRAAQRA